ncbi:MAG: UDP-glucose/GDP-mannose dehydrogenase family protein [Rubrobacteraceae bacterium]|nr:UDP-glucose/GDP-mannose dehydrogenase family protein [Rubrobacteraceae bacterium]
MPEGSEREVVAPRRVAVVGAGHVGLVTAACLAYLGCEVTAVDSDPRKVEALRRGNLYIHEPHLRDILDACRERVRFTTDLEPVVLASEVLFVAVGTPGRADGSVDLSGVEGVARGVGRVLGGAGRERPLVVVNKSTVPVGGGDYVSRLLREGGAGEGSFRVVSNPEFLREGRAVLDTLFPDRVVLGGESEEALEIMRELYRPIVEQSFPSPIEPRPKREVPLIVTDLASAETIKYAANAFLATKISFINEISRFCELVGADVGEVARGIGLDHRIGGAFLEAGIGWGGSCFPKDVAALRAMAGDQGLGMPLLAAAEEVNLAQRREAVCRVRSALGGSLEGERVALLGLSFKPGTEDLRGSPALEIAALLIMEGARVAGYDPVSAKEAARRVPGLEPCHDPYSALEDARAAVVATAWEEVRALDLVRAAAIMREPRLLVDGRNALDPEEVRAAGLLYSGFGRG